MNAAVDAAARVWAVARATHSNVFAGAVLTDGGDKLSIFLTRRDAAVEALLASVSGLPEHDLSFGVREITEKELLALHARVLADKEVWRARGFRFAYTVMDLMTGLERVGVIGLTEEQRKQFFDTYGAAVQVVEAPEHGNYPA